MPDITAWTLFLLVVYALAFCCWAKSAIEAVFRVIALGALLLIPNVRPFESKAWGFPIVLVIAVNVILAAICGGFAVWCLKLLASTAMVA